MYKIEIQGCLPFLILFLILFFVLKLWYLIVLFILVLLAVGVVKELQYKFILKQKEKEQNYTPNKGEVYKLCRFCGAKVKRSAEKCPQCGHSLD